MEGLKLEHRWCCFQIGAREHFAIPRSLHQVEALSALVTDMWFPPGSLSTTVAKRFGKQVQTRFHSELQDAVVVASNLQSLQLEILARLKSQTGWQLILQRNQLFQRSAANVLKERFSTNSNVVFSFSYAAKEVFRAAKSLGCKTVLGQIDPGPFEMQLVADLHRKHGLNELQQPPPEYWNDWRGECDLADHIIVNSEWSRQALVGAGIDKNKLAVVPLAYEPPVDVQTVEREPVAEFTSSRPLRILFLGQVIARKGIVELTEAISRLNKKKRNVVWTIVGGGDPQLLAHLKTFDNVEAPGQVDRGSVVEFYQRADAFILPTHSDGFAITQLEAVRFGVPVIASKYCGDVVEDGVDGILLTEVSVRCIVDAVEGVLDRPSMLDEFRGNLKTKVLPTVKELAGLLEAVVGGK